MTYLPPTPTETEVTTPGTQVPENPPNFRRVQDNEIGVILGKKGSGKTTLSRHLAAQMKRKIILDSLGTDYGGGCIVSTPADLVSYHKRVSEYDEFSIIARPQSDEMPTAVFRLARRTPNSWLIVEECDRYADAYKIQPDLAWLVNYARQQNTSILCICRRAARLSRDITANADWIVAHNTQEPRDLEYLAEYMNTAEIPHLQPFTYTRWGTTRLTF